MSRPRVAVACASFGVPWHAAGGASVHLRALAAGYRDVGCETQAWALRLHRGQDAASPVPVLPLPRGRLPGALRRRRPWLERRVDGRAAEAAASRRRVDLVHERFVLGAAVAAAVPSCFRVVEVNAPVAAEAVWFEGLPNCPGLLAEERRTLLSADRVVVVSAPLAEYVARRGVHPDRVLLLPNGSDATPRPRPTSPVVGHAGTYKAWQGLLEDAPALAAWAERHDATIELWGDGPLLKPLLERLPRARALGWGATVGAWTAVWSPPRSLPPWPFDEPGIEPYFDPLKEADAASAGLPILRGGVLMLAPAPRPTWKQVAAGVLQAAGITPPG